MGNEISTGAKTSGQFTIAYQKNGYGGVIPVIDGKPEPSLMFGYATESDKNACMRLIEEGLRATNGDIYATQRYIMNAVQVSANEIKPDETAEVEGYEILISYADKKAYINTKEIANLEDMAEVDLPNEAIKAMLIDRARLSLEREMTYDYDEDDYDEYMD